MRVRESIAFPELFSVKTFTEVVARAKATKINYFIAKRKDNKYTHSTSKACIGHNSFKSIGDFP